MKRSVLAERWEESRSGNKFQEIEYKSFKVIYFPLLLLVTVASPIFMYFLPHLRSLGEHNTYKGIRRKRGSAMTGMKAFEERLNARERSGPETLKPVLRNEVVLEFSVWGRDQTVGTFQASEEFARR